MTKRKSAHNRSVQFAFPLVGLFFVGVVLSSWVGTQFLAAKLSYQDGLGSAWMSFGRHKLYQPFSWWAWGTEWRDVQGKLQELLSQAEFVVMGGAVLTLLVMIVWSYRRSSQTEVHEELHGSAHWASREDIEKMRFITHERVSGPWHKRQHVVVKPKGFMVGAFETADGRFILRYDEPAHVLAFKPSRSGKGVGLIIPTLLTDPNSTFTNDVKGENFENTSGFRHSAGSLVMRFDPTAVDAKSIDGRTRYNVGVQWNALDEVRINTDYDVMDAQNIAAAVADPKGEGMDDHWVSTSYELLVGVILHVLYFERDKSLTGVAIYLADPSFTDPEQMYNRMLEAEHDPSGKMGWVDSLGKPTKTHPQIALAARSMLNKEEKERNSVLSSAKTKLALYTEPIVARNTSRSDFRIEDLMRHNKAVSFYMVQPPSDKARLRPLTRLFLTMVIMRLAAKMEFEDGATKKDYQHALDLLLDELISLGKLEHLADWLSYIAGYGIRAFLFVQDKLQLAETYGDKETITSGCQLRIASAPNTLETAKELSGMSGVTTITRQNVSYSGSRLGAMLGQMSVSEELVERPLLTDDEAMRLPRDEVLIFNAGHPPIRGKKLAYYAMPELMARAKMTSPSRVSMSYRDQDGRLQSLWFMVHCERIKGDQEKTLKVVVNTYSTFPRLNLVLKQLDVQTEQLHEYRYELCGADGKRLDRELTLDDLELQAKAVGDVSGFEPDEAYEVHFVVADPSPYKDFSQRGFFREMSLHEREARRAVKALFYKLEAETGAKLDPSIESPNGRQGTFRGEYSVDTAKFIGLVDRAGSASIHRKAFLSKLPSKGQGVTITYSGKTGVVL